MILVRRAVIAAFTSCLLLLLGFVGTPALARVLRTNHSDPTTAANTTTVLRGRASWYGSYFQGKRTSSGERYNRHAYTCAHKTLPFGTRLRVTNVKNGKSVIVRVSDRGPFRHQRILDLSEAAAHPLGIVDCGAATVVAEIVAATTPLGPATTPANLAALYDADPNPDAAYTTYKVTTTAAASTGAALVAAAPVTTAEVVDIAESVDCPAGFLIQAGSFVETANAEAVQARIKEHMPEITVTIAQDLVDGRQRSRVLVGHFGERPEAEAVRQQLLLWGIGGLVREVALR